MDMLPAYLIRTTKTGERLCLGGDEAVVLATSAETGGALFAVELRMPPGGGPPVMHRHDPGEVYRVLDGEFTFYIGDGAGSARRVTAGPGAGVPLAGGVPHTVRNESDADAVAFVVHAPGAPMEGFVRAATALAATGRPSMQEVLEIAARYGVELLGPIPAT
jgi:mannose-6-phosphate isomerase-like protein (cupin superfamily)